MWVLFTGQMTERWKMALRLKQNRKKDSVIVLGPQLTGPSLPRRGRPHPLRWSLESPRQQGQNGGWGLVQVCRPVCWSPEATTPSGHPQVLWLTIPTKPSHPCQGPDMRVQKSSDDPSPATRVTPNWSRLPT